MERAFLKEIRRDDGSVFAKRGEIRDYPLETWIGIARSLFPKAKDLREGLEKVTVAIEKLGEKLASAKG